MATPMNLDCDVSLAAAYKSRSQIARVLSEDWCGRELYCPACPAGHLYSTAANTKAIDFHCRGCGQLFQLKSSSKWDQQRIVDAAYAAMLMSIKSGRNPNLMILQYGLNWTIENLLLVPRFFFTESVIEKRNPLGEQARRAGWVGCNILLSRIPADGKINVIANGMVRRPAKVRHEYKRMSSLAQLGIQARGWTLDVLNTVRQLGREEFSLQEVYACEKELQSLHPQNRNVRPKIRQQLQVLRDMRVLEFGAPGQY